MPALHTCRRLGRGLAACLATVALSFAGLATSTGASHAAAPNSASSSPCPTPVAKKGVSTWSFDGVTPALAASGVSWYYDWGPDHPSITSPCGVEFVPMIWGSTAVFDGSLDKAKSQGSSSLLGFNEPDKAGQSNMSPQEALHLWPKLMATGLSLGSPAVATNAASSGSWLDQFMQGARGLGYRVDFITVHWYGGDFTTPNAVNQLRSYLQAIHNRYQLPIWLTEYALVNYGSGPAYPTTQQQTSFVTASTTMLQSLPYVQRYAWYALPATKPGATGLYQPGGTPNETGSAYAAAGR
ncbi:glycoside hydrolase family protein [Streptomyces sp. NPDC005474]|uniref:glycoside hydrolase family protein n=1 Tax=Streptomyces sp. NPDC005474 TaxID=3154878 RepID=UPI003451D4DD